MPDFDCGKKPPCVSYNYVRLISQLKFSMKVSALFTSCKKNMTKVSIVFTPFSCCHVSMDFSRKDLKSALWFFGETLFARFFESVCGGILFYKNIDTGNTTKFVIIF